jgi:hypothetical protein
MLSPLADAGPRAVEDFIFPIETGLSAGRTAKSISEWSDKDKPAIDAAFKGLAALGTSGRGAAPAVIAALQDKLARYSFYLDRSYDTEAMEALIRMGEVETLPRMYAGKSDAARIEGVLLHLTGAGGNGCPGPPSHELLRRVSRAGSFLKLRAIK